jgi:hypothetical protein
MVAARPDDVIGLQGAHPKFPALAAKGVRWAKSQWLVGVGYVIPVDVVRALLMYRDGLGAAVVQNTNEDDLISRFCVATQRHVWHPIPTIIDHDTHVRSTYANDSHEHRRATVTWRTYPAEELERDDFWRVSGTVPVVSDPHQSSCWACEQEPGIIAFQETGLRIGRRCIAKSAEVVIMSPHVVRVPT